MGEVLGVTSPWRLGLRLGLRRCGAGWGRMLAEAGGEREWSCARQRFIRREVEGWEAGHGSRHRTRHRWEGRWEGGGEGGAKRQGGARACHRGKGRGSGGRERW